MNDRRCLVGVDIGGTKTSARISCNSGRYSRSLTVPTAVGTPESVLRGTIDVVESLVADSPDGELGGLGVGVPGKIDPTTGSVRVARNLGIGSTPFPLGPALTSHLRVPTAIENDVRAASLGLYSRATDPRPSTLTYLSIGTGVAAGTVVDGRLLRGAGGVAGEIGQIIVGERKGTIATIETESASVEIVAGAVDAGLDRSGYLVAHAHEVMSMLAEMINTIFLAYDPGVLIIGGGVGTAPGFFEALMDSVQGLRSRSDVVGEFLDPLRITVLAPDDPIGVESALLLAEQARFSVRDSVNV